MALFAARYASALADVVLELKLDAGAVDRQLADFAAAWHGSPELREVFLDPSFPAEQKVSILDKMNARLGMSQPVRNFVAVLIDHGRVGALDEVIAAYHREVDRRLGISEVEVTTARTLGEDERRELERQVALLTGGRIKAEYREDRSLLGGIVLQIGSTVYDGSLRGRFERLREQLAG